MDETILLAEALLKQLLVGAVDVAEPLAEVAIVTALYNTAISSSSCAEQGAIAFVVDNANKIPFFCDMLLQHYVIQLT